MRIYETTFILSPQADDAAFDRQIKSVTDLIEKHEGKILEEDRWGIRRLSYPIRKYTQGYYTRCIFEGNNDILSELERMYRLEEQFIRHLTVVYEGKLPESATKPQAVEKPAASPVEKPAPEPSVETEPKKDDEDSSASPADNPETDVKTDETSQDVEASSTSDEETSEDKQEL